MPSLAAVEQLLTRAQREFDQRVGEARALSAQYKAAKSEADALDERAMALEEAVAVLTSYADERAASVIAQVEGTVSEGLRAVFADESLTFVAHQKAVGKRTEIEFLIRSITSTGEVIETAVMDARGGGVAAVAGFLLRVVMVLLRPDVRKVLFLDESFAQVSAEYEPALAEFLHELVQRTSIQIVMVTHSSAYSDYADVEYRVKSVGGRTIATVTAGECQ